MLSSLTNRIELFGARWARKRQGIDNTAGVTLERRRIYILPTRYGAVFALVLFAMLLGSINYGANLAYAMTFLLAGLVLVILHHCHNNLLGIKLRFAGADPVFAGELASFRIAVSNNSNTVKNEIEIALPKSSNLPLNLAPDEAKTTKIKLRCESRGWQNLSRFPPRCRARRLNSASSIRLFTVPT